MRRFWFGVAAIMGVILVTMVVYYGKALYDHSQESKRKFENGTLFKRY